MPEDDGEEDLAATRQKKMASRMAAMQKQQEAEDQKRSIAQGLLAPDAYERIMNVRIANPELYEKVLGIIAYLAQNRQLKSKVTDGDLKKILAKLTERRETSIEFKSK
jgi:programmed cell death protein 5